MRFLTTLPPHYYYIALLIFMMCWWLVIRLRSKAGIWRLRYYALPRPWLLHLHKFVPHYRLVPLELRAPYQDKILQFVDGKNFRHADPLELVAEDARVTIASNACILLLNDTGGDCFEDVLAVQLWPPGATPENIESASRPVKCIPLIWNEERHEATDPHDALNPALPAVAKALGWEAYGRTQLPEVLLLAPWARQRASLFAVHHPDALKNVEGEPADVFAIATEMFYAAPDMLHRSHPKLYDAMRQFYSIDPARWKTKA